MDRTLAGFQRGPRAATTWTATALLRAILRGADHRNSHVYRKCKTLAHDAGLVASRHEPDPDVRAWRGPPRAFFYALAELEAAGFIAREYRKPRDPRHQRCSHPLRSRCGCPHNKGQTVLTVLFHTDAQLRALAKAQIARAGAVLVRPPRAARGAPNEESRCTPESAARCTPASRSRCTSLSVSTTVPRKDRRRPLRDPLGRAALGLNTPATPVQRASEAAASPRFGLVSTPATPNDPPTDAPREVAAPPARDFAASPTLAPTTTGFEPGGADRVESTEGGRARAVPPRALTATAIAVLKEHRERHRQEGPPTRHELIGVVAALRRGWTAEELGEATRGAAASDFNAKRALYRTARWLFADDDRIQACLDFEREAAARRSRAAARAAAAEDAGVVGVQVVRVRAVAEAQKRETLDPRQLQLLHELAFATGERRRELVEEYWAAFGERFDEAAGVAP